MTSLLVSALAGPLPSALREIILRYAGARVAEREIAAEVERAVQEALERTERAALRARRDVLKAELAGESWLQRHWRPIVALTAFFSYWFVIVAYPFLHAWGLLPAVRFGEEGMRNLFWLACIAGGGYIGGRTLEKVFRRTR